jgi:glycosyltransferase involved in cell wall biosynthesis
VQYIFVNNTLETYTIDGSGAIATHIASVRDAAHKDGLDPLVLTRRHDSRPALDSGPTVSLRPVPKLPRLAHRVVTKALRLQGWQGHEQRWYARQVRRALARLPRTSPSRVLVLHNDPDVADHLAPRFRDDIVMHVWHNVLPYGGSRSSTVRHLAVSDYLATAVAPAAGVVPVVVRNGVDPAQFHPAVADDGLMTVSFLGRTGIEKGPDLLLKAILGVPEHIRVDRVLLIGSNTWGSLIHDDYQAALAALIASIESRGIVVEQTGHLGREAVGEVLRTSDIHVVPSRWEDPAPLVLMEAMASGLCVVAARSGGMPEYGGDAVLWFERDDVDDLVAQLGRALTDSTLRDGLRRRARARAEELTWQDTWQTTRKTAET